MKAGTIYIGHLPRGFYDDQLRGYFSQFGTILKIRLARSKKTGGYKGYGYIQFASDEVAKIAAETMNNYLMFDRLVQCEYIPEDKLHPSIWKGANKKFVWLNTKKKHVALHNKTRSKGDIKKSIEKLKKKDSNKRKQLLALGIQYEFPTFESAIKKVRKSRKMSIGAEKTKSKRIVEKTPAKEVVKTEIKTPKSTKKSVKTPKSAKKLKKKSLPS